MTLEVTFNFMSGSCLLFAGLTTIAFKSTHSSNTPISINYLPTLGPLVQ